MKRTYEWKIKDGEIVWSQWIVPTEKKTPIFRVAVVEIDYMNGNLCLILRGEGIAHFAPFYDGLVWVWQERPL